MEHTPEQISAMKAERKELLQQMKDMRLRVNEIENIVNPLNIKEHAKAKLTPEERELLGL